MLKLVEKTCYPCTNINIPILRAYTMRRFIFRELIVFNTLAEYLLLCSVNTGESKPLGNSYTIINMSLET